MIFFAYCNLRSKCLHSSFCGKVEAEQGGRGRREDRAGLGRGKEETFSSYSRPNFLEELVRKRLLLRLCLL